MESPSIAIIRGSNSLSRFEQGNSETSACVPRIMRGHSGRVTWLSRAVQRRLHHPELAAHVEQLTHQVFFRVPEPLRAALPQRRSLKLGKNLEHLGAELRPKFFSCAKLYGHGRLDC
jgi:hypothetical protein